jgi:hypothetical protein
MDRTPPAHSEPAIGANAPAYLPLPVLLRAPSLAAAHLWAVLSARADDAGRAVVKAADLVGLSPALGSVNTVRRAIDDAAGAGLLAVEGLTGTGQRVTLFMLCKTATQRRAGEGISRACGG